MSVRLDAGELFGRQLGKRLVGLRFALDLGSGGDCRGGHGIPCRLFECSARVKGHHGRGYTMVSINTEASERSTTETEPRGHFHELGERVGHHLLHHLASVGFYRDFTDAELATDLLVQPAGDHQVHDLAFATGEGRVTVSYCPYLRLAIQCSAAALDGLVDGAQQDVVAKWLRQELDSSPLHRLDGHRHVSVACDGT